MEFKNTRIVKKANVYYDGKVTSRTIYTETGERKTLGIMLPGNYEFDTGVEEFMEIFGGEMDVCLPGQTAFKTYREGDSFTVPAKSKFKLRLKTVADYCCTYKDLRK